MNRLVFATLLVVATSAFSVGCRSCQSCHDYDPPVDSCTCNQYGAGRAGSVLSGGNVISEVPVEHEYVAPTAP